MKNAKQYMLLSVAVFGVFFGVLCPSARAQSADPANSPVGQWEAAVSGQVDGESTKGTAFLEFDAGGGIAGYYLVREYLEVWEVSGSWTAEGKTFSGEVTATLGATSYSFAISGKAKANVSMSARLSNDAGDNVKFSGKARVSLSDRTGSYTGSFRQAGYPEASLQLEFIESVEYDGLYELIGTLTLGGETYDLSGLGVVDRKGNFIGGCENTTLGTSAAFWGKFKSSTSLTGSGISLDDDSRIRFSLVRD